MFQISVRAIAASLGSLTRHVVPDHSHIVARPGLEPGRPKSYASKAHMFANFISEPYLVVIVYHTFLTYTIG